MRMIGSMFAIFFKHLGTVSTAYGLHVNFVIFDFICVLCIVIVYIYSLSSLKLRFILVALARYVGNHAY